MLLQNQRFFKKWQCQLFQWNTISAQSGSEGQSDLDNSLILVQSVIQCWLTQNQADEFVYRSWSVLNQK